MRKNEEPESLMAKAAPAKSFFVNMLTRDIELTDAILDLLDNCVDGIIRSRWPDGVPDDVKEPYQGFSAKIDFDKNSFSISDNCGGIPLDVAEEYAFMMGRKGSRDENLATVGIYGIGMKRAIFKMGKHSVVTSHTHDDSFEVVIDEKWMQSDEMWDIPIKRISHVNEAFGTTIRVSKLYEYIQQWYDDEDFENEFIKILEQHYSFIILKGFGVIVNNKSISPAPLELLFSESSGIKPYLYEAKIDDVSVSLQVGFSQKMLSPDEVEEEQKIVKNKEDSGWTIICNDRVVLYKDKDILTGWGEADVPKYHNQFNGINGIVIFKTNKPEKLPLTTTKRGVEANSSLYLRVKNHMRIGTKIYTSYTYNWKKDITEERKNVASAQRIEITRLKELVPSNKWQILREEEETIERVYTPKLPKFKEKKDVVQISFERKKSEVAKLSKFLFEDSNKSASQVGIACFERVLEESRE